MVRRVLTDHVLFGYAKRARSERPYPTRRHKHCVSSRPTNYKPESDSEYDGEPDWDHGTIYGYTLRRVEWEVIYCVASW